MGRLKCHTQTFEDFYLSSSLIWLFGTNSPLKRHSKLWHSYLIVISCFWGLISIRCFGLFPMIDASHTKKLHFSPVHEKNNHFRLLQAPFNNRNQQCHRTQNRNHFSRQQLPPSSCFLWCWPSCKMHLWGDFSSWPPGCLQWAPHGSSWRPLGSSTCPDCSSFFYFDPFW